MGTTETQLRNEAAMQRSRVGETLEAIGDRISPERMVERRKAAVGIRVARAKETIMGSPQYVEPMTNRLGSAGQSMADTAHSAAGRVQHAPEAVADQARGNPIAAGVVAFGVGALLATVMPKSRAEQQLVDQAKPQLDHAKEELKGAGRELAQDAKEHAQQAAEQVKSTSTDAASHVGDQAQQSAQQVKQNARR